MLSGFYNGDQKKPIFGAAIAKITHYAVNGFSSLFNYARNEKPTKGFLQHAKPYSAVKSYEDKPAEIRTFTSIEELLKCTNQNKFLVSDLEWNLIRQYLNSIKPIFEPIKVSKRTLLNFSKLDFDPKVFHSFIIAPIANFSEDYLILAISHHNIGSGATNKIKMAQSNDDKLFILKMSLKKQRKNYSVTPYINGYDLDYLINIPLYKTVSDKFKIEMAIAITIAYRRLYRAKIAHGDIHPGNIILKIISNSDVVAEFIDFEKSQAFDTSANSALFKRDLEQLMKVFLAMRIPKNVYNEFRRPGDVVFDLKHILERLIRAQESYEKNTFVAERSIDSITHALLFNYRLYKKYEVADMYNHPERYSVVKYSPSLIA